MDASFDPNMFDFNDQPQSGPSTETKPPGPSLQFPILPFARIGQSTSAPYIVRDLIPRGGLTIVWGPPKCGKTFWLADVCLHISMGWQYREFKTQQASVLYISLEGNRGIQNRISAFRKKRLLGYDESTVKFGLLSTQIDLARDHDALILDIKRQEEALGWTPEIVVIDTLNRSLSGSENDAQDMASYIAAADKVRTTLECSVIIIHHCGYDDTRLRGHSSLSGALDAEIAVRRSDSDQIVTEVRLMKDGEPGAKTASVLETVELEPDEFGDPVVSCVIAQADEDGSQIRRSHEQSLPPAARVAMTELTRALSDNPQYNVAGLDVPHLRGVALVTLWRRNFYAASSDAPEDHEATKKAFQRASTILQARGVVRVQNGYAWTI